MTDGRLRSALTVTIGALRASPGRAAAMVALLVVFSAAEGAIAWFVKGLIDGVFSGDFDHARRMALALGLATVVKFASEWLEFTFRVPLVERTGLLFEEQMVRLTATIPDIEHHERPEYLDKLQQLRDGKWGLGGTVTVLAFNLSAALTFATTLALLATVHPVLLLLPLSALPSFLAGMRSHRIWKETSEAVTEGQRLSRHLFDLGTTAAPGKEVRVFGLRDTLLRRHDVLTDEITAAQAVARRRMAVLNSAGWTVFSLGYVAAMAFVVREASYGRATAGEVALALVLAADINRLLASFVGAFRWLMDILLTIDRYRWLVGYASERGSPPSEPAPAPGRLVDGITLREVTFSYPGADGPALEGVDLHLPAGSTVALVGENGAGKTTLVKLLCGFYRPTGGAVLVDGVDLQRIPPEEWRSRLSAAFQDFTRFELVTREAVTIGDLDRLDDPVAAEAALGRAGGSDIVERLPEGLETPLGYSMENGRELSGGQWQKLALGRAYMRTAPLLLMLDEPTAALDADTEHTLFSRYSDAARAAARASGAITILVSHRFSTVAMADLIVVVGDGRILEVGSHQELMSHGAVYAELFRLQARSYS